MRIEALAKEIYTAHRSGTALAVPPSELYPGFTLAQAYEVEAEIRRLRQAEGHRVVGYKVGYANKAVWRALKLETLVWAAMYDDTVGVVGGPGVSRPGVSQPGVSQKIEPEIVIGMGEGLRSGAAAWIAFGFEIIDCPWPDWRFTPADFVAGMGLHRGLVIGERLPVEADGTEYMEGLASLRFSLLRDGVVVEEGAGKNSLRSPALCLAEFARVAGIRGGEMLSTGTLTAGQPIQPGETWQIMPAADQTLPIQGFALRI